MPGISARMSSALHFSLPFTNRSGSRRARSSRKARLAAAAVACLLAAALSDSLAGSALALANPTISLFTPAQGTVGTNVVITGGALKRAVAP